MWQRDSRPCAGESCTSGRQRKRGADTFRFNFAFVLLFLPIPFFLGGARPLYRRLVGKAADPAEQVPDTEVSSVDRDSPASQADVEAPEDPSHSIA